MCLCYRPLPTSCRQHHLQKAKRVKKGKHKGAHHKRRERAPLAGMMLHQDGATHAWVEEKVWDRIITMDDASSEIYSGFFVDDDYKDVIGTTPGKDDCMDAGGRTNQEDRVEEVELRRDAYYGHRR